MRGLKLIRNLGPYTLFAFCGVCALLVFTPGCPPVDPCAGNPCDDGLYCNGVEVCTAVEGERVCTDGEPVVCPEGEICDEETDACVDPCETITCDDDDLCTTDECVIQTDPDTGVKFAGCVFTPVECITGAFCNPDTGECVQCLENADCQDGLYCNGAEQCLNFLCVAGVGPCAADTFCNEAAQTCDPIVCTDDADCDDLVFCNGAEACVENECIAGTDPCPADTPICVEATQECVECVENADCPEGQSCVAGACVEAPPCTVDADCDDEDLCTTDTCDLVAGICVFTPVDCDDGVYCNGVETCNADTGACESPGNPCGEGEICDEATDSCQPIGEFVLTEDIDVLIGTANPDTFRGSDATYNTGDFLDGRGGIDRLDLTTVANEPDLVDVLDIERIFIKNTFGGQAIDLSGYSGYDELWYQNGNEDLTLEFVDELAAVGFVGGRGPTSDFTVEFGNALVDQATDELSIFLDGTDAGDIIAQNAGGTEGFETITVNCTGNSEVELIESPDLESVLFTGPGNLDLQDPLEGAETIDSTGLEGDLDITCDDGLAVEVTLGNGTNTVRFGVGEWDDDDEVTGGTGEDTVVATLDSNVTSPVTLIDVEILSIMGDGGDRRLDLGTATALQTIRIESHGVGAAGVLRFEDLTYGSPDLMFRGDENNTNQVFDSVDIEYVGADTGSQSQIIEINNQGEDLEDDNRTVTIGFIDIDEIEDVTITNNDGGTTTITDLNGAEIETLTIISDTPFTITNAIESTVIESIDTTDSDGDITLDASNAAVDVELTIDGGGGDDTFTAGLGEDTIDGGDGDDELIGGGLVDTISGGAGDDILDGGDGVDELTGGAGDDTFRFGADNVDDTDADLIEDFEEGNNADEIAIDVSAAGGGVAATLANGALVNIVGSANNSFIVDQAGTGYANFAAAELAVQGANPATLSYALMFYNTGTERVELYIDASSAVVGAGVLLATFEDLDNEPDADTFLLAFVADNYDAF